MVESVGKCTITCMYCIVIYFSFFFSSQDFLPINEMNTEKLQNFQQSLVFRMWTEGGGGGLGRGASTV